MHCLADIVVSIVRPFELNSVLSAYIIRNYVEWTGKIREVSKLINEETDVQPLKSNLKHEAGRLEVTLEGKCFMLRRLFCSIVPPLFDFIIE